jgi:hypothetical protein
MPAQIHPKHPILIVLFIVFSLTSSAQTAKYSNEFLNVGIGARSIAMGKAYIATADDVTAAYWNPAGLAGISGNYQAGLMHAQYFAGIAKFDYLGVAGLADSRSAIGVTLLRYGVDDIPNTTELIDPEGNIDYNRIKSFSVADYALLFSYARVTGIEGLNVGGNFKIIRRLIGEFASAWGFGGDISVRYNRQGWTYGAVVRDVTSTFNAWKFNHEKLIIEVGDSIFNQPPDNSLELTLPRFYIGAARTFRINDNFSLLAEVNTSFTFDGRRPDIISSDFVGMEPVAGFELGYGGLVFLRAGLGNLQRITEFHGKKRLIADPSAGLGLHLGSFYLDYAMSNISPQTIALYSNIFSIRYVFGNEK